MKLIFIFYLMVQLKYRTYILHALHKYIYIYIFVSPKTSLIKIIINEKIIERLTRG